MDYREGINQLKAEWIGKKVIYGNELHTVVDVDYNGALLIDKKAQYAETTAVGIGQVRMTDCAGGTASTGNTLQTERTKTMFEYLNLNPNGKLTGDCVKRAIAKATGIDYKEVVRGLNKHKKVTGAKAFNSDGNWQSYIENICGGEKMSFPVVKGQKRMNGQRFSDKFTSGSYVLRMAGHLTACVDGVIYDTWDCSEKCVYCAWKIK